MELLSVDNALEQILSSIFPLPAENIPLSQALGRVLAKDIFSQINLPPFVNSSMDGYAVRAEDVTQASKENPINLRVIMDIPAGFFPEKPLAAGEAARIMTGAPLPEGGNCVIPVELTDARWYNDINADLSAVVKIYHNGTPGENVRQIGEDIRAGARILEAGTLIRPAEIGVLAGLGKAEVSVIRQAKVAILGTGNELVDIEQALAPGKIRDTNSYTLEALVKTSGGLPIRLPIAKDSMEDIRNLFHKALALQPDMIISSAGVSVGAADLVRAVLDELGEISLWRINLRPGKPLAYGHLQGIPFFGLPGNPVSAMVTFDVLVRPALLKLNGKNDDVLTVRAVVGQDLRSDGRRSYLRVRLKRENGQIIAHTTGTQSSNVLTSMVLADGLLVIPENVTFVTAGSELTVRLLRHSVL